MAIQCRRCAARGKRLSQNQLNQNQEATAGSCLYSLPCVLVVESKRQAWLRSIVVDARRTLERRRSERALPPLRKMASHAGLAGRHSSRFSDTISDASVLETIATQRGRGSGRDRCSEVPVSPPSARARHPSSDAFPRRRLRCRVDDFASRGTDVLRRGPAAPATSDTHSTRRPAVRFRVRANARRHLRRPHARLVPSSPRGDGSGGSPAAPLPRRGPRRCLPKATGEAAARGTSSSARLVPRPGRPRRERRPRRGAGGPPRPPRPRRGSVLVLRPLGLARRRRPPERVTYRL